MNFKLVLLLRARLELLDAWEWYEDKQTGLGDKFKKEVYSSFNHILIHPEHYPRKTSRYREALVYIFPYVIIYSVIKKERIIVVSSVFHTSRNPGKKYK